jgi:hypothetical protein
MAVFTKRQQRSYKIRPTFLSYPNCVILLIFIKVGFHPLQSFVTRAVLPEEHTLLLSVKRLILSTPHIFLTIFSITLKFHA